ncbi:hypothetical protein [Erysipelothrix tonsillarum]|uniref:hypothetical protein n=1 Tax=Erysipelothrix tonsillarum TaxID=38402 RepID=UPI0039C7A53E
MMLTNEQLTQVSTKYPHLGEHCNKVMKAADPIRGVLEKALCMTYLNIEAKQLTTQEVFNLANSLTIVNHVKGGI